MLLEAAQAVQQAAQAAQGGSISIVIPTAFASSVLTILGREALILALGKKRRNGNGGPRPGEADVCRIRGERMTKTETKVEGIEGTLTRYEGYFQDILRRLPK